MIIYPAVDIKDGKAVRLKKGDFNQVKVYFDDPADAARKWIAEGTTVLHVVDLDGAKDGRPVNTDPIKRIVDLGVKVQLGGGLRNMESLRQAFDLGIWRAVLGTALIKDETLAEQACTEFGPDKIVAGVDLKGGQVAVEGWLEGSGIAYETVLQKLQNLGIRNLIVTDIDRDGMQGGPNFNLMRELVEGQESGDGFDVIASGGVHELDDLIMLKSIGVAGAITGTALYENRFNLKEAIRIAI